MTVSKKPFATSYVASEATTAAQWRGDIRHAVNPRAFPLHVVTARSPIAWLTVARFASYVALAAILGATMVAGYVL